MSLIGKRHPATANAFLVVRSPYFTRGPATGDVVTLSGAANGAVFVELAGASGLKVRTPWTDAVGWTMYPEHLHPLDAGARAALELVRR